MRTLTVVVLVMAACGALSQEAPLAERWVAQRFCSFDERDAFVTRLDDEQRAESVTLVLTDDKTYQSGSLIEDALFVAVWRPRIGDAFDVQFPAYRGVTVKEYERLSNPRDAVFDAGYGITYPWTWGIPAGVVTANRDGQSVTLLVEVTRMFPMQPCAQQTTKRRSAAH